GQDALVVSGASEGLAGGLGNDAIDGGGGADLLLGGSGDDTLAARDGIAEVVSCGDRTDHAVVDQLDAPDSCEGVDTATVATPGADAGSGGAHGGGSAAATDAD